MHTAKLRAAPAPANTPDEDGRTGLGKEALKQSFLEHLFYLQGKFPALATRKDYYMALAYVVRDRLLQRWISTAAAYTRNGSRTVAYLSAEFLTGPHLGNNLINLGIYGDAQQATAELGLDLDEMLNEEQEPGPGNGGLGRLAACFLDSMASLEIPSLGYGMRYEFGIFDQDIVDGWQVERTDKWLRFGNPWELLRPEWTKEVKFGGKVERYTDLNGRFRARWLPDKTVIGIPYDTPILGYATNTANTLRLWRAEAPESFDFHMFNRGDYYGAVNSKVVSENITKVLYPNDEARIRFLGDEDRIARLSLIDESGARYVRMANLACVGSHAVNGVAALHSELLTREVLADFHALWLEKFSNKTNGVTPRRWVVLGNPRLTRLINEVIGAAWIKDLSQLKALEPLADDAGFRRRWQAVKLANKQEFSAYMRERTGVGIDPAADLSEQISTAGKEASGTGNMKFSMNGALTIGTLDGANIEIRDAVGAEHFFAFGLTTTEVAAIKARGYDPRAFYLRNDELREVVDLLRAGFFSRGDTALFRPLIDDLLTADPFMVMADYAAYAECQERVGRAYSDSETWARMSILNVARSGLFSSDCTIREYCEDIWTVTPQPIRLLTPQEVKVGVLQ